MDEEDQEDEAALMDELWNAWLESDEESTGDEIEEDEDGDLDDLDDDDDDDDEDNDDDPPEPDAPGDHAAPLSYPSPPCTIETAQGDCIVAIAGYYRVDADAIWGASENAQLAEQRPHNQLFPGDQIDVPDLETKTVSVRPAQRHVFQLIPVPTARIRIKFLRDGEPRTDIAYEMWIDGAPSVGNTDPEGVVECEIQRNARGGCIVLTEEDVEDRYFIRLGYLNPLDSTSGIQMRLRHLGHRYGDFDEEENAAARSAVERFQHAQGLEVTGEVNGPSRSRLLEVHSS